MNQLSVEGTLEIMRAARRNGQGPLSDKLNRYSRLAAPQPIGAGWLLVHRGHEAFLNRDAPVVAVVVLVVEAAVALVKPGHQVAVHPVGNAHPQGVASNERGPVMEAGID